MNLPWFGFPTEAVEPHQLGGSESLGIQFTGFPAPWRHSLSFRTFRARLYRMGTRRRQLAHGRFRMFLPTIRRLSSVAYFYVFRPFSRRITFVAHSHTRQFQSRRIKSFAYDHGFSPGFRRIRLIVHGFSSLLSRLRRIVTACREELPSLTMYSAPFPASGRSLSQFR